MGRRDYSPKRRDDKRHSGSSSSSRREEVSKMKEKMRSGFKGTSSSSREEYTHSSEVLDKFEASGFQPASFRSGGNNRKETAKEKSQSSHDTAIFGPAWKSAEQIKKIEAKQELVENIPMPIKTHVPMIPANMLSENTESRKKLWFDYWKETRRQLLTS